MTEVSYSPLIGSSLQKLITICFMIQSNLVCAEDQISEGSSASSSYITTFQRLRLTVYVSTRSQLHSDHMYEPPTTGEHQLGTYVRAGSPSSCVCTACSSTPRLAAACLCGRPPERGRPSGPAPPGPPPAAPPPPPGSSDGPPGSPRSQLQRSQSFTKDPASGHHNRSGTKSRLHTVLVLFGHSYPSRPAGSAGA